MGVNWMEAKLIEQNLRLNGEVYLVYGTEDLIDFANCSLPKN